MEDITTGKMDGWLRESIDNPSGGGGNSGVGCGGLVGIVMIMGILTGVNFLDSCIKRSVYESEKNNPPINTMYKEGNYNNK